MLLVQEMKFNLIGFTSHAQMASHLLKECRGGNKLNIALLEVGDREGSLTLFQSNIWNMERHFLIGGARCFVGSQDTLGGRLRKTDTGGQPGNSIFQAEGSK